MLKIYHKINLFDVLITPWLLLVNKFQLPNDGINLSDLNLSMYTFKSGMKELFKPYQNVIWNV